jgi:hypothetical protein
MAEQAAEYHHGQMDIHAQRATFKAVMTGTKWASLTVAVGILFLTLLFCTTVGFAGSLFSALVLAVAGFIFLRSGSPAH